MENHKSPWTSTEEKELLHRLRLGESIARISKKHQRTERAIEMRIAMILDRMLKKGDKISNLSNEFHLSDENIQVFLKNFEENKRKFNESNENNIKSNLNERMEERFDQLEKKINKVEIYMMKILKNIKQN